MCVIINCFYVFEINLQKTVPMSGFPLKNFLGGHSVPLGVGFGVISKFWGSHYIITLLIVLHLKNKTELFIYVQYYKNSLHILDFNVFKPFFTICPTCRYISFKHMLCSKN